MKVMLLTKRAMMKRASKAREKLEGQLQGGVDQQVMRAAETTNLSKMIKRNLKKCQL